MLRHVLAVAMLMLCTSLFAGQGSLVFGYERLRDVTDEKGQKQKETVHGHGTAFVLTSKTFLTCAHNIIEEETKQPYKKMHVIMNFSDGVSMKVPVRAVYYDTNLDLAIVEPVREVKPEGSYALAENNAEVGDKISIVGSMKATPIAAYNGHVLSLWYNATIRTKAGVPFNHGLSGAPVLNEAGEVVGLAVAGVPMDGDLDPNIGLYVPVSVIRDFMRDLIRTSGPRPMLL